MSLVPGAQTVHTRESWQDPKFPVFGPLDDPSNNVTAVIHYTADDDLIDGDPGEHADDLPAYLRAMQRSYVLNRGHSLGYLWAVDWLGGIWQIRGWEYQSAANKGENATTWPILVLVDGDDPATPEAIESIRLLIAEAGRRAGSPLFIKGHRDIGATACPGAGLYAQIKAGLFSPRPTPPPIPPSQEDDDMPKHMYIAKPPSEREGSPWLLYADTEIREANSFDLALGLPVKDFGTVEAQYRVAQYDKDLARARRTG